MQKGEWIIGPLPLIMSWIIITINDTLLLVSLIVLCDLIFYILYFTTLKLYAVNVRDIKTIM